VLVPETTLRRAGIGKDVVVIGVRDHLEVWDAAKWEAFVAAKLGQYDEMARKAYETELEDRRKSSS